MFSVAIAISRVILKKHSQVESYLAEVELCRVWLYFNVCSAYPPVSPGPSSPPGPHHHTNLDSVFQGLHNGSSVHSIGGAPRSTVCHCLLLMPFLRSNHTGIRPAQGPQGCLPSSLEGSSPKYPLADFFLLQVFVEISFSLWDIGGGGCRQQNKSCVSSCVFPLCVP